MHSIDGRDMLKIIGNRQFLSVKELADLLGMSKTAVLNYLKQQE